MIQGENINLRPLTHVDLEQFEGWTNDPLYTSQYNNFGLQRTDSLARGLSEDGMIGARHGMLVVVTKNGAVVGDVSYRQVMYGPEGSQAYSIGITIASEHRGNGYGVEAQRLLAAYLLATYPIMRIEAQTDITNIPEQRALEKAGFTREGVLRKAQWRVGAWHDLVVYSKLRGE